MIRILLVAMLLSGCATVSRQVGPSVEVQWLRAKDLADVERLCSRGKPQIHYNISGCQWNEGPRCYVVAMDYGGETLTTLGHEVKHCFDGKWHM